MINPRNDSQSGTPSAFAIEQTAPLRFVEAFLREPLTVGSLWPSSATLSRVVVDSCEFGPADTVVELGPGIGSFTELLLERLDNAGQLLAFEISETNFNVLRQRFPRCRAVHDSAVNLPRHLGHLQAKCIVSGLAWATMLPAVQDGIMNAVVNSLAPNGQFVAFSYVHTRYSPTTLRFRKMLFREFARVETTPVIWRNLPPAYVYRCWRSPATTGQV